MAALCRQQESGAQWALAALVAVAFVAGLTPLVEVVNQSIAQASVDAKKLPGLACGVCGVVEDVREVIVGNLKHDVSTVTGEGFAMFVGLLTGKLGAGPVKIYEVAVRLQDGSTRVLREGMLPAWKPGDQVKVVTGQIKPASY
jgi:hypothetical protein